MMSSSRLPLKKDPSRIPGPGLVAPSVHRQQNVSSNSFSNSFQSNNNSLNRRFGSTCLAPPSVTSSQSRRSKSPSPTSSFGLTPRISSSKSINPPASTSITGTLNSFGSNNHSTNVINGSHKMSTNSTTNISSSSEVKMKSNYSQGTSSVATINSTRSSMARTTGLTVCNNSNNGTSIRPPRPTSIPSVPSPASTLNGCTNNMGSTTNLKPVSGMIARSITTTSQKNGQKPATSRVQPLKDFMGMKRIEVDKTAKPEVLEENSAIEASAMNITKLPNGPSIPTGLSARTPVAPRRTLKQKREEKASTENSSSPTTQVIPSMSSASSVCSETFDDEIKIPPAVQTTLSPRQQSLNQRQHFLQPMQHQPQSNCITSQGVPTSPLKTIASSPRSPMMSMTLFKSAFSTSCLLTSQPDTNGNNMIYSSPKTSMSSVSSSTRFIPQVTPSGLPENGMRVKPNDSPMSPRLVNTLGICIPTPEAFRDPVENDVKSEEDDEQREEVKGLSRQEPKSSSSPNDKSFPSLSSSQTGSSSNHPSVRKEVEDDQGDEDDSVSEAARLRNNERYSPTTSSSTPSPPMFSATLTTSASPSTAVVSGYPFSLQVTPSHQSNGSSSSQSNLLHELRERRTRSTNASCESSCGNNGCDDILVKYPSLRSLVTPPPTPSSNNHANTNGNSGVHGAFNGSTLPLTVNGGLNHVRRLSKNGELRGSAASLLSASSNFSSVSLLLLKEKKSHQKVCRRSEI